MRSLPEVKLGKASVPNKAEQRILSYPSKWLTTFQCVDRCQWDEDRCPHCWSVGSLCVQECTHHREGEKPRQADHAGMLDIRNRLRFQTQTTVDGPELELAALVLSSVSSTGVICENMNHLSSADRGDQVSS